MRLPLLTLMMIPVVIALAEISPLTLVLLAVVPGTIVAAWSIWLQYKQAKDAARALVAAAALLHKQAQEDSRTPPV